MSKAEGQEEKETRFIVTLDIDWKAIEQSLATCFYISYIWFGFIN